MKPTTLLLLVLLLPTALTAATKSWTGAAGSNWSNGANWADGTPPAAGDDLLFGNAPVTTSLLNDLPAGTVFRSMTFAAGYDLNGNSLGLTHGMSTSGGGEVNIFVPLSLAGSQTWFGVINLTAAAPLDLGTYTLTLTQFRGAMASAISGSGGIIVESEVSFSANNTYIGPTIVRGQFGILHCACGLVSAVTSADGGTFVFEAGAHTAAVSTAAAMIAVGDSAASSGSLSLDTASAFLVRTASASRAPLSVTGSVSLDDARLSFAPTFTPPVGTVFTLIDNDGADPVIGTFGNLPEGARFRWSASSPTARISYAGGSGNDVTLTIIPEQIATTTILSATPNPTPAGQQTTLMVTVAGADVPPGGIVTFFDGSTALAVKQLITGSAVALVGPLSSGVHSLTATYQPDNETYAPSTSDALLLTVGNSSAVATSTSLSATPRQARLGENVTLIATVTSPSGTPAGTVIFIDGEVVLAARPLTAGVATFATVDLAAGTHALRATFAPGDASFAASSSSTVIVTVADVSLKRRAVRP